MGIIIPSVRIGLNIIGAWPGASSSRFFSLLYVLFVSSLVFQLWNMMLVVRELDLLMNNLGTTMPVTSIALKLAVVRLKYGSVKFVVREMLEDWKSEKNIVEHEVMMKNKKIAALLSNVITICYNGLVMAYIAIAIMSYNAESINDRQFVMQATFPMDAKKSPLFEILCCLQVVVAFFGSNGHAVLEGLLTVSVLHASTKAFGVCQEISNFSKICQSDSSSRKSVLEAKQKMIAKHLNFINFTERIQDIYAYVSFFHLILMTLINCIVGYMLININSINEDNIFTLFMCIAYMLTAMSAVASYCIAGEYLTYQGTLIFEKLCNCPWYKFKPRDSRILIFMIMRSRQPVAISAGSFSDLSLVYFTYIFKTSASYLSMVRATINK